jgi:hypothetical protein
VLKSCIYIELECHTSWNEKDDALATVYIIIVYEWKLLYTWLVSLYNMTNHNIQDILLFSKLLWVNANHWLRSSGVIKQRGLFLVMCMFSGRMQQSYHLIKHLIISSTYETRTVCASVGSDKNTRNCWCG